MHSPGFHPYYNDGGMGEEKEERQGRKEMEEGEEGGRGRKRRREGSGEKKSINSVTMPGGSQQGIN